jgi:hypothetical protein
MRMGGVRVRGTVPIAEDTEGVSNDPIGAACGRDAEGASGARHLTAPVDLVFANRNGDALRRSTLLTRALQPASKSAALGRVTWHRFRHIHSSLLAGQEEMLFVGHGPRYRLIESKSLVCRPLALSAPSPTSPFLARPQSVCKAVADS